MNFAKAIEYMKQGEAVRQKESNIIYSLNIYTDKLQKLDKDKPYRGIEEVIFMRTTKIMANNWELVE